MPSYFSAGGDPGGDEGVRPIRGAPTAVAALVGSTEKGPVGTPVPISSWTDYAATFGGFVAGAHLPHAVAGYFQNGGGRCYVVRVGAPSGPLSPEIASPAEEGGDGPSRTSFESLEVVGDVTMVAVPDLMSAYEHGRIDLEALEAVQGALIAHCEHVGGRMAILDAPPGCSAEQVSGWLAGRAGYDSKQAALYWPWVHVRDPLTGATVPLPPSGHVAGVWARSDVVRGVHRAPANEVVRGALSVEAHITRGEQDLLNPIGVNCLRQLPDREVRLWGARTLSSDPAWRSIGARRLVNHLEKSILDGTDWVAFEANGEALWGKIRRSVDAFLLDVWRSGALVGATPDEAFFVRCDAETNPLEGIDLGQVVCQIGVALTRPLEFRVVRMTWYASGAELVE